MRLTALVLGVLLPACLGSAKHGMRINAVVGHMRPTCDTVTHAQDETEDWVWWVNACGETLWCRYDERGEMVCGERDTLPVSKDVVEVARFVTHCDERTVKGRKEVDRAAWHVTLCGDRLNCAMVGGSWQCEKLP